VRYASRIASARPPIGGTEAIGVKANLAVMHALRRKSPASRRRLVMTLIEEAAGNGYRRAAA
jgi:hypothetical protein